MWSKVGAQRSLWVRMAEPKSPSASFPAPALRGTAEDAPGPADPLAAPVSAGATAGREAPLPPEALARNAAIIRRRGLAAARDLAPELAGHCIECGEPVPGRRAFCSDACMSRRVRTNRERVAAIAQEWRTARKPRD